MNTPNNFDIRLKKLKEEYGATLPNKVASISAQWSLLRTEWSPSVLEKMMRDLHSLIGSSGTFGFPDVGRIAREIEVLLKKISLANSFNVKANAPVVAQVNAGVTNLIEVVKSLNEGDSKRPDPSNRPKVRQIHSGVDVKDIQIYYLDNDLSASQLLTNQLVNYGFKCEAFACIPDLLGEMQGTLPDLVILDLDIQDITKPKFFELAKRIVEMGIKVFILSASNEFENHLSAVRSGIHAYIEKPADIVFLVEKIRGTLHLNSNHHTKILIVDDQESVAEYYATVLRSASMYVQVEVTPQKVLQVMSECMPDLVLLDLNMPHVSGLELAAIIRQRDQFQSIPIVFLSGEAGMHTKSNLLEIGTDDLLTKGMSPEDFLLHVKSRVNRSKALASKMRQDSLTGLLNHAQIHSSLEKEFLQSGRRNKPFSVAMIDIDNFKSVNDTYGHQIGDRVIVALAHLLAQRLRNTDYIGRFGGEEFMLVMPDCNADQAATLINKLRVSFTDLKFDASGVEFSVSFSAGVSDREGVLVATEQLRRADEALYQAKRRGRNTVCVNYADKKMAGQ